jgi:hypothetical protein
MYKVNEPNKSPFKENANRILGKSSSTGEFDRANFTMEEPPRQKLGMGYEEGRDLYEGVHARRALGFPPNTKIAADHYEIEKSIYNRSYNQYGQQSFENLNNPKHHRIHNSRRSYNMITADINPYERQPI